MRILRGLFRSSKATCCFTETPSCVFFSFKMAKITKNNYILEKLLVAFSGVINILCCDKIQKSSICGKSRHLLVCSNLFIWLRLYWFIFLVGNYLFVLKALSLIFFSLRHFSHSTATYFWKKTVEKVKGAKSAHTWKHMKIPILFAFPLRIKYLLLIYIKHFFLKLFKFFKFDWLFNKVR